jgi:lysine decarboxylase/arginine decarboxylase
MAPVSSEQKFPLRALVVDDEIGEDSAAGRAIDLLVAELHRRGMQTVKAKAADDALSIIKSDPAIQCLLLDWDLGANGHTESSRVIKGLRERNAHLPIFLLADRSVASTVPVDVMSEISDFVWMLEDTVDFIGGRIHAQIDRYRGTVLPPLMAALAAFNKVHEFSWHTPGHTGGTAFLKTPVGRAFFEFFGEQLLRSDLSISVDDIGSLLDHSGPVGASERYIARVFGSHRSYHVTNGSSMSNRVILMSSVSRDQVALCDRNCHKSAEHSMTMSGALPVWMVPTRNHLGIIGPIPPKRFGAAAIKKQIAEHPLAGKVEDRVPKHAIVTNSTYDGLCYSVTRVEDLLGKSVDRLHFDEAWYAYARFNPIYQERHAMHGDPAKHDETKPTVFCTHSTHKLLAALSQASFIHVRDGRSPIPHRIFNESYMMHASTSPSYPIIASNDVAAAMMDGPSGPALTRECIEEAVAFRQMVSRIKADYEKKGDWFLGCWQPDEVQDPKKKKKYAFHEAPPELLAEDPSAWVLHPDADWHGFDDLEDGYCMLDPIKVSVVTPGMTKKGYAKTGIPAGILTSYLGAKGIVPEKTTDFTVLFLFSIGITKGKWGSLVAALCDFKRDYDTNAPLEQTIPSLLDHGDRYAGMGLKDLADQMFATMTKMRMTETMSGAFSELPHPDMSPVRAYEHLVKGHVELVGIDKIAGRTLATSIVPYPPGIPMLMPGENAGPATSPFIGYLKALETYDENFPGFHHHTHGVDVDEHGKYFVHCLIR